MTLTVKTRSAKQKERIDKIPNTPTITLSEKHNLETYLEDKLAASLEEMDVFNLFDQVSSDSNDKTPKEKEEPDNLKKAEIELQKKKLQLQQQVLLRQHLINQQNQLYMQQQQQMADKEGGRNSYNQNGSGYSLFSSKSNPWNGNALKSPENGTPESGESLPPFFSLEDMYNESPKGPLDWKTPGDSPKTPISYHVQSTSAKKKDSEGYSKNPQFLGTSATPYTSLKNSLEMNPNSLINFYNTNPYMYHTNQNIMPQSMPQPMSQSVSDPSLYVKNVSKQPTQHVSTTSKTSTSDDNKPLRPFDPKKLNVQPKGFRFVVKPARKSVEHFLRDIPGEAYSHPYKYDLRVYLPDHLQGTHHIEYRLYVEKMQEYVYKNNKGKPSMRIEDGSDKYIKTPKGFYTHRVVFQVCSFHFQRSHFQLHVFAIPNDPTQGTSEHLLWKSSSFELFARKTKPDQWPSHLSDQQEKSYEMTHKSSKRSRTKTYHDDDYEDERPTRKRRTRLSQDIYSDSDGARRSPRRSPRH